MKVCLKQETEKAVTRDNDETKEGWREELDKAGTTGKGDGNGRFQR